MSTSPESTAIDRYDRALMSTYGQPARVFTRGEGCWLWDVDGNRYLDLLGGIAVTTVGHANPAWVAAIAAQAATVAHVSNLFATEPQIALAERLLDLAQAPSGSRVFFCNSGAEANEAALKMARKTGRGTVIALDQSFHGRTLGALSVTGKAAIRDPFLPLLDRVVFVPRNDGPALASAVRAAGDDLAAIIVEPIQGESGIHPLTHEYLRSARELATQAKALLIIDEVQSGIARTGAWFAHQRHGIVPDVMTMAKGLGGGFPIGAVVAFGAQASGLLVKGDHGTTFGGNALAAAAALATLDIIVAERLIDCAKDRGEYLRSALEALPGVVEVRGEGLMLGVVLAQPVSVALAGLALDSGFVVNAPAPDTLRVVPPLIITQDQAQLFVDFLAGPAAQALLEAPA